MIACTHTLLVSRRCGDRQSSNFSSIGVNMDSNRLGSGWMVALASTTALTVACSSEPDRAPSADEKPASIEAGEAANPTLNKVYSAEIVDGKLVNGAVSALAPSARR